MMLSDRCKTSSKASDCCDSASSPSDDSAVSTRVEISGVGVVASADSALDDIQPSKDLESSVSLTVAEDRWSICSLVSFRIFAIYFLLFCLDDVVNWFCFSLFGWMPGTYHVKNLYLEFWHPPVFFIAEHILRAHRPIVDLGWPFADTAYGWARVCLIAFIALLGGALWSFFDRRRSEYSRLQEWLILYLRLALIFPLVSYGAAKVVNTQFHSISLSTLESRVFELTPMSLMWAFMAYSPSYCFFGGLAELMSAALLAFRRTTLLGALLSLVIMTNVFFLNLSYGVHVKLYSFHLLFMSLVLVAPDAKRLFRLFVLNRPVSSARVQSFSSVLGINKLVFLLFGLVIFQQAYGCMSFNGEQYKHLQLKSPIGGIWEVTEFLGSGIGSLSSESPWSKILIERQELTIVGSKGEKLSFRFDFNEHERRLVLGEVAKLSSLEQVMLDGANVEPRWIKRFVFETSSPGSDALILKGFYQGKNVSVKMKRVDKRNLQLFKEKFRWITSPEQMGFTEKDEG